MLKANSKQILALPFALAVLAIFTLTSVPALATTYTATTVSQLISDLDAAQSANGATTINLVQNATYTLTAADNSSEFGINGLPAIMTPVTINGNGATISRAAPDNTPDFRFFDAFASLTLNNLTLSNGNCGSQVIGDSGESILYFNGGAIDFYTSSSSASTLNLTNCTITGCSSAFGGGISNDGQGTLTLTGSTLSANTSQGGGGIGAVSGSPGPMSLTNCVISGNSVTGNGSGGAIDSGGGLTMLNCTVSDNNAAAGGASGIITGFYPASLTNCTIAGNTTTGGFGGAINNEAPLAMTDCTISGNTVDNSTVGYAQGAGLLNNGTATLINCTLANNIVLARPGDTATGAALSNANTATLTNCTISGNTDDSGTGAIADSDEAANGSTTTLVNCIAYGDIGGELYPTSTAVMNASYCDVQGGIPSSVVDGGHNISGDPLLGMLVDNGGPTQTVAIGSGSAALHTGTPTGAPTTDQRGDTRPNPPSIGAYEPVALIAAPTPTISPNGGTFNGTQPVQLSDSLSGATIHYTTDGSTPSQSSTLYGGTINVSSTKTINAIAVASNHANSAVASASFTIDIMSWSSGIQMISLPYSYASVSLDTLFGYTAPKLAVWNPGTDIYSVSPTPPADQILLGQGYWVRFPQAIAVTQIGTPATPGNPFDVTLQAGWNMIGDPWTATVPITNLKFAAGTESYAQATSGSNQLIGNSWGFNQSADAYFAATSIEPGQGYWLYAFASTDMEIPSPAN